MSVTTVDETRKPWALRMTESEKAQIKARADEAGLSMTEYMVRAALGELDVEPASVEQRLAEIDERLNKLERVAEPGAYG